MTRSIDPKMNAALEADAAKLEAMGQDAGPALEDFFGDEPDHGDCPNCGGDGFYADCLEEWACVDPESGCDLCMRRCDWCGGQG